MNGTVSDRKGGPVAVSGRFALDLVGHSSTHLAVISISVRCQCTAVLLEAGRQGYAPRVSQSQSMPRFPFGSQILKGEKKEIVMDRLKTTPTVEVHLFL